MKLYTVKEAAKTIGVSTNTLYKYLDEDRIHAARGSAIQGRFRIPETALEEFLGVKLSPPEAEPLNTASTQVEADTADQPTSRQAEPLTNRLAEPSPSHLPLKIARFLLILALLAVLLDLVIANTVSVAGSISRILFLAIMIILAYGEGGYRRS